MKKRVEVVVRGVTTYRSGTTVDVEDPAHAMRRLSFAIERADTLWWADRIGKTVVLFTDDETKGA